MQIQCCYKCKKRQLGCHSFCEIYIKAKEENDKKEKARNRVYYGGKSNYFK